MHRLRKTTLTALLSACLLTIAACGGSGQFQARMPDQLDPQGGHPLEQYQYPETHTVELDVCTAANWPEQPTGGQVEWRIVDDNVLLENTVAGCETTFDLAEGDYSAEVLAIRGDVTVTEEFTVDDILVVSIGDSFAAGEGNKIDRTYFDEQCHRSEINQHAFAAEILEGRTDTTSVTYLSVACSGAEADQGVLNGWDGTEPRFGDPLPSQLDQIAQLVCGERCSPTSPMIDILLISAGGNDAGFADLLRACVLTSCDLLTWGENVRNEMPELRANYGRIQDRIDELGIRINDTYMTLYPTDLFSAGENDFHASCVGDNWPQASFHDDEARSISILVAPHLVDTMRASAIENGWYPTFDPTPLFYGHGMCEEGGPGEPDEPWIIQISIGDEAPLTDGLDDDGYKPGHAHPNEAGHRALAENIVASIDEDKPSVDKAGTVTVTAIKAGSANHLDATDDYDVEKITLRARVDRHPFLSLTDDEPMTLAEIDLDLPDGPLVEGSRFDVSGQFATAVLESDERVWIDGWMIASDGNRAAYVFEPFTIDMETSREIRRILVGTVNFSDTAGNFGHGQVEICVRIDLVDDEEDEGSDGLNGDPTNVGPLGGSDTCGNVGLEEVAPTLGATLD